MAHNNLNNYYRTMFGLIHYHKYDPDWVDDLMVYEKDIYVSMLLEAKNNEKTK